MIHTQESISAPEAIARLIVANGVNEPLPDPEGNLPRQRTRPATFSLAGSSAFFARSDADD